MVLSNTSKTAIKAVTFLSSRVDSELKFSINDISKKTKTNAHSLAKVLQTLVKFNIIKSVKGPLGGFYITRDQMNLPLIKVIEAIDGNFEITQCVLSLEKCDKKKPCVLHEEYIKARTLIERMFFQRKIHSLITNNKR